MSRSQHTIADAHEFAVAFAGVVTEESEAGSFDMIAKNGDESLYAFLVEVFPEVKER